MSADTRPPQPVEIVEKHYECPRCHTRLRNPEPDSIYGSPFAVQVCDCGVWRFNASTNLKDYQPFEAVK